MTSRISPSVPSVAAAPETSHRDDIVFVGLNPTAPLEADALAQHAHVTALYDKPQLDLREDAAVQRFVAALELAPAQRDSITRTLLECSPQIRDELGQLCQVWARAEHGDSIGGRLVLSGHCYGSGMFGDGNGEVDFDALARLAEAMPRAAATVEDLAIDGCNSGSLQNLELFREAFPNLKTFWGYQGHAPGASSGAVLHEARWERATHGGADLLDRRIVAKTRLGEAVTVWSRRGGFQDGLPSEPRATLEDRVAEGRAIASAADRGEVTIVDTQAGPLRAHYEALQDLSRHPQTPAAERTALGLEIEKTLKLLYYQSSVATHFADHYAQDLDAGYRALGRETPAFGHLPRSAALSEARAMGVAARAHPENPALRRCADLLERGLVELAPALVPVSWA